MRALIAGLVTFGLGMFVVMYADAALLHAAARAVQQTLICAAGIGFGALLGLRRKMRPKRRRRPAYAYAPKRRLAG